MAERWAENHGWKVSYGDNGPLFVTKSARRLGAEGRYSLLQPARTWLWGISEPSQQLRRQLLESLAVEEIVNLTALQFGLFAEAVGPAVMATGTPSVPSVDATLSYLVVKPDRGMDKEYDFEINAYDVHEVRLGDALDDFRLWTTLTWGWSTRRLLRSKLERLDNLVTWVDEGFLSKQPRVVIKFEVAGLLVLFPAEVVSVSKDTLSLVQHYMARSVLSQRFMDDMLHIALATIAEVDALVSWNFRHIVRLDKIRLFNAVNMEQGYKPLTIYSPREVISYTREG